jgi:hypothetical protein
MCLIIGCQPLAAGAWLYKFTGHVGEKSAFDMTLRFESTKVEGVYFYHKHMRDIRLSGEIKDQGSTLELHEHGEDGNVVAQFKFRIHSPEGKHPGVDGPSFEVEPIEGTWSKIDGSSNLKVTLDHTGRCTGELGNLYGNGEDDKAHKRMKLFWDSLKNGDKEAVASCISFPIRVSVKGKKQTLQNKRQLLAAYPDVFDRDFVAAVSGCPPRNLWNNHQGLMLGSGLIWFNSEGAVLAINH